MPAKTILITGASSGLGQGMAREFAALGRDLALCARRTGRLEALRDELLKAQPGIRVAIRPLDVTDHAAVFETFHAFDTEMGGLDRIIVNAGIGAGRRVGTGHFADNLATAQTNFVAALAQCEAALELFRSRNKGHLVVISSMSALRGLPRHLTTYAATKAGLAALTEGIQADLLRSPIRVSSILPGYIRTELNEGAKRLPFAVSGDVGSRLLVKAIEREPAKAYVPAWPWAYMAPVLRLLPLSLVAKLA
ncbi:SDR family oxidoreductase [Nitrospirillum sp. BR 11164]|uniref:SDR family oxidoreductase n=1 Tax=Nitrospirillum sp. BR 11164 TaxID=3104324 RepID=UPI002AFEA3AC|nr:SDR family oxidoreductase [Nitrospirillum sp. BR 11164]MEA1651713.1 SDR family oxidoreductase [Nitrospirillum sp. BR 11164]